jgi:hypothetical protein
MGMRPSLSYLNIHPSPTANLSSTTERSMIYDRGHPSTTFLSDNRIRVEQGLHSRHCKPCFESGFRASSKKPIRTHLKKYHAEDFKVAPVTQSSPDRYRCCETEFDIESWADHVVDHHCYFANTAASSRLDHSQSSSSFRYASTPASSSTSEDTGSPYQVTLGSSTIGQSGYGKVLTPMSQSQPPLVPPYLLQTLTPITPSDNAHDRQLPFAGDASGNVLFDHLDNRIVRTCDWQQAFALDGTGNLVRDRCGVPIPISPGQLLYAYSDSGDRLTYHYGIDVL